MKSGAAGKLHLSSEMLLFCKTKTRFLLPAVTALPDPGFHAQESQKLWRSWPTPSEPSIAEKERNLTVAVGDTVRLPCLVSNLHDKTVSWIRGRDLTVLAVDRVTYTGDHRFSVIHSKDSDEWILELRGVLQSDSGMYDCQVNTYPKLSTKIHLRVIPKHALSALAAEGQVSDVAIAPLGVGVWKKLLEDHRYSGYPSDLQSTVTLQIEGRPWVQVDMGSTLRITCSASGKLVAEMRSSGFKLNPDERIIGWNLDDVPVTILFPEWKVNVEENWDDRGLSSQLTIISLAPEDSGKLSCVASNAKGDFVQFSVKEDKSSQQQYLGLSNSKMKDEQHHHSHPVTSAVSAAPSGIRNPNSKFAVMCATVLLILMLTNIVACFHYLRKI